MQATKPATPRTYAFPPRQRARLHALGALLLTGALAAHAQNQPAQLSTSTTAPSLRLAAADFKPGSQEGAALRQSFDKTLNADLINAGIFEMVPKTVEPKPTPGMQQEINLQQWAAAPISASMVAFGNLTVAGGRITVNGFLDDAHNTQFPQVFAKQYSEAANEDMARQIAHRFADEIISRLGGGIPGIAETKIYYVRQGGGNKEIWEMDYDGANQHAITHLGAISISPRVSPDNARLAFSSLAGTGGFQVRMYSLLLGRVVGFPAGVGATSTSPAWSPNGQQVAFSSSRGSGDPEIWVSGADGNGARRLTSFRGPDSSPTWNPKTGAQIAWISGRTGLPQLYIMDSDGSGVVRLTDGGYVSSPSWSPNGQFVAFAWDRKYGPGAPGGQDIYTMDIATKVWTQLTHDTGPCDFPSWSPDGRHIVYANGRGGGTRIMTMQSNDGSNKQALTGAGSDMPNWSWK